ncbi:hypothetical protein RSP03_40640 [Cereibacter sphaeroides]|nr:hypothetical protein RSP03_40640 [Cereibacter sphaeroides]
MAERLADWGAAQATPDSPFYTAAELSIGRKKIKYHLSFPGAGAGFGGSGGRPNHSGWATSQPSIRLAAL